MSSRTISRAQVQKTMAGKRKVQQVQERDRVRRVIAFQRWLKVDGGRLDGSMPDLPSDADYSAARSAGRIK